MFCRNCGAETADNARFCIKCGVIAGDGNKFCSNCGATPDPKAVICVRCGCELKPLNNFDSETHNPQKSLTPSIHYFDDAIKEAFNKYATFQGRATRPEFWYWILFGVIVNGFIFLGILMTGYNAILPNVFYVAYSLFNLVTFLPSLAVTIRRLHDIGKSGWNYLVVFIPFIGWIFLLVWCGMPSDYYTPFSSFRRKYKIH